MKTSVEYCGCNSRPLLDGKGTHNECPLFSVSIYKTSTDTESAQETETYRITHVGTQRRRQSGPCRTPLPDACCPQSQLPITTGCDRASADPHDPLPVIGTGYDTDTAMGTQPHILNRPTFGAPTETDWNRQLAPVRLSCFFREFFFTHLANRLYLSHGLG